MNASDASSLTTIMIVIGIFIAIFLAARAIMLWYWRIDEIIESQARQTNLLRLLLKHHIGEDKFNELMEGKKPLFEKRKK